MTPDTSTQAVEAHAKTLDGRSSEFWKYAALLRALAAERDELVKAAIMQKAAYEGVSSMLLSVQKDCIAARRTALEDAAKVCEEQMIIFASDQYATNQPLSSFGERFACSELAKTILSLPIGPHFSEKDIETITQAFISF